MNKRRFIVFLLGVMIAALSTTPGPTAAQSTDSYYYDSNNQLIRTITAWHTYHDFQYDTNGRLVVKQ